MSIWKALLLVYRRIDVRLPRRWIRRKRFANELSEDELRDALNSFRAFPSLVEELSNGEATVTYQIEIIEKALPSVTAVDQNSFWLSPDDTRTELDALAPAGRYDSIFVFWPQSNLKLGAQIPCRGWGFGLGPSDWTNGATYAVIGNAPSWAWSIPVVGEVWLHEWLHGVCRVFDDKGFAMPEHDADAGGSHGYVQSETTGWTAFYRDLMTGQVLEKGVRKGITAEAWRNDITPTEIATSSVER
jgi:hypothetical protein